MVWWSHGCFHPPYFQGHALVQGPRPAVLYRQKVNRFRERLLHRLLECPLLHVSARHEQRVVDQCPPLPICQELHHQLLCCAALRQRVCKLTVTVDPPQACANLNGLRDRDCRLISGPSRSKPMQRAHISNHRVIDPPGIHDHGPFGLLLDHLMKIVASDRLSIHLRHQGPQPKA